MDDSTARETIVNFFGIIAFGAVRRRVRWKLITLIAYISLPLSLINSAFADPAEVILIRHAEKPEVGNDLSLRGRERAAALAPYFMETPELLEFKTPVAIYAQRPKNGTSSIRSVETVRPLANALHVKINDSFVREQFEQMVDEIRRKPEYEGHTVLVCWEHKVIPEIAAKLDAENAPKSWPDAIYDRTWLIKINQGQKPTFIDLPQRLLFGDSKK
jgi:hypothetical protein